MKRILPLVALLTLPTSLTAQSCPAAQNIDTLAMVVGVQVRYHNNTTVDERLTEQLGTTIASRFTPSSTISRLFYPGTVYGDGGLVANGAENGATVLGSYSVTLAANGETETFTTVLQSEDPATDAHLMAIMLGTGPGDRPVVTGTEMRKLELRLVMMNRVKSPAHSLLRVQVPVTRITTGSVRLGGPSPEYPRSKRSDGVEGMARLRFAIDENGKAVPSSMRLIRASDEAFVEPSIKTILASSYSPALAGECPVKSLVEQRVVFRLNR